MNTAVIETAKALSPLSTAIATGIYKSIDKVVSLMVTTNEDKYYADIAHKLKGEYKFESVDYIEHMVRQGRIHDIIEVK